LFWLMTESVGLVEDFYFVFVPSGYYESAYDDQQVADYQLCLSPPEYPIITPPDIFL
jgi:hypothetical protein